MSTYTTRIDIKGERLQDVLVPDECDSLINSEFVMKLPWDENVNNEYLPHKFFICFLKAKKIKFELI